MKPITLAAVLICLLAGAAYSQYQIGEQVADFTLNNYNGSPVSLSDYSDRIVFMTFWYSG